jgi:hypothetical protein
VASPQLPAATAEDYQRYLGTTPAALLAWVTVRLGWRSFDAVYLFLWGGRYLPSIAGGQWWLWMTGGVHFMTSIALLSLCLLSEVTYLSVSHWKA